MSVGRLWSSEKQSSKNGYLLCLASGVFAASVGYFGSDMLSADLLSREITATINKSTKKVLRECHCLICNARSRDIYNHRTHMLVHLRENVKLWAKIMAFREENIVALSACEYTCLICGSNLTKSKQAGENGITRHFIVSHLLL